MSRNALAVAKSLSDSHELFGGVQRVGLPLAFFRLLSTRRFAALGYHEDPYEDPEAFVASVVELVHRFRIDGVIGAGTATTDALIEKQGRISAETGARVLAGDAMSSLMLTDKWLVTQIAREAGVSIPLTCLISDLSQLGAQVRAGGMNVPFVIKPRRRSGSVGLRIFKDWDQVASFETVAIRERQEGQEDGYIAQEFVSGSVHDGNCVAKDGRLIAAMSQARVVTAWDFGGGGIVNMTHREPAILDAVQRLVAVSRFTGIAQFEFLRLADGQFMLLECNPKIFGTTYLPTAAGINLVKIAVDSLMLGNNVPEQTEYEEGLLYRWIFPDCVAYWFTSPWSLRRMFDRIVRTFARNGARRIASNLSLEDLIHQTGNVIGGLLAGKKLNRG